MGEEAVPNWLAIYGQRKMGLTRIMCIALLTPGGIVLAHVNDHKIAAAAKEATSKAMKEGGFLAGLQATAGAGRDLIAKYQAMPVEELLADDSRNGLIAYDTVQSVGFKPSKPVQSGPISRNVPGFLEIGTASATFPVHLYEFPDADGAAKNALGTTFGSRLKYFEAG